MSWIADWRRHWNIPGAIATWIVALVGGFWLQPPASKISGSNSLVNFSHFLATEIVILMLVLAVIWRGRQYVQRWALMTILSLVACNLAFFFFCWLSNRWIITYPPVVRSGQESPKQEQEPVIKPEQYIIGSELAEDGKRYLENKKLTCLPPDDLLRGVVGGPDHVWTRESIENRRLILNLIYILSLPIFICCLISGIQVIDSLFFQERLEVGQGRSSGFPPVCTSTSNPDKQCDDPKVTAVAKNSS